MPSMSDAATTTTEPSADQVRAALAALLKSDAFNGAARQQRLLKHLVEKKLGGGVSELKEYTLGVEVFDRGEDFDSRLDPIVRVEASRLRSRLQKYYEGAGAGDAVRISLPRGAYVPSFTVKELVAEAVAVPAQEAEMAQVAVGAAGEKAAAASDSEAAPATVEAASVEQHRMPLVGKFGLALSGIVFATVIFLMIRHSHPQPPAPDFLKFRRLTSDIEPSTKPTFSPDGKRIAYARRDPEGWNLYVRDLDSMHPQLITPGSEADNTQPAWSPLGDQIAFRSERDGGGLFLVEVRTSKLTRLTTMGFYPAWSPDGKTLAFSTGTFREPGETFSIETSTVELLDVDTLKITRLGLPGVVREAVQPAFSPDGRRVAYWSSDDGERDIWTVPVPSASGEQGHPVRITHDAWTDWSPVWSPDGRYVYFSSDRGGAMNLWRVRIDEQTGNPLSDPEPVTTPSSYSGFMTFAPSGKAFAYVHRLVSTQLFRAPFSVDKGIDVAQRQQLTAGERIVREPDVSPDGKWIVARVQDPQEDLALIHPDGTELHRITNDSYTDRWPHWSPDGKEIIFLSNRSDNIAFQLWSIRPDGSGLKQLTQHGPVSYAWTPDGTLVAYPDHGKPYALENPSKPLKDYGLPDVFQPIAWSPDGKSVAGRMRTNEFGPSALFVVTPGASDYWRIATDAPYTAVDWMRDSQHLLFSRSDGFHLADIGSHSITPEPIHVAGQLHTRFTASPDGAWVYFVVSDDEEDIWLGSE